ncbi:PepSY domain-containing protein [Paraburkholderia xenovorans]
MKNRYFVVVAGTGFLLTSLAANAFNGQEYLKDAKISLKQARVAALNAHPGKITDEELEKEAGGSGLRYSFDIRTKRGTQEVGVDAQTGSVLGNSAEGANPD